MAVRQRRRESPPGTCPRVCSACLVRIFTARAAGVAPLQFAGVQAGIATWPGFSAGAYWHKTAKTEAVACSLGAPFPSSASSVAHQGKSVPGNEPLYPMPCHRRPCRAEHRLDCLCVPRLSAAVANSASVVPCAILT